jgi:hypothetical protein
VDDYYAFPRLAYEKQFSALAATETELREGLQPQYVSKMRLLKHMSKSGRTFNACVKLGLALIHREIF